MILVADIVEDQRLLNLVNTYGALAPDNLSKFLFLF